MPIQTGINATLAAHGGHPLFAAAVNMTVAATAVYCGIVAFRVPLPVVHVWTAAPWYAWFGGLCGAAMVFSAIVIAPRLGAAGYVSAMIVGTVVASLLIDHFGLLGFRPLGLSPHRVLGGLLVIVGMLLVNRY